MLHFVIVGYKNSQFSGNYLAKRSDQVKQIHELVKESGASKIP